MGTSPNPEAQSAPSPFDPRALVRAVLEEMPKPSPVDAGALAREIIKDIRPEAPQPKSPWEDESYWLIDDKLSPVEASKKLHEKIDAFTNHKISKYEDRIKKLEDTTGYFDLAKADNSEFKSIEKDVVKIMDEERCGPRTAMKLLQLQRQVQTAPPKPVPPPAAQAPSSVTGAESKKGSKSIRQIINESIADGSFKT